MSDDPIVGPAEVLGGSEGVEAPDLPGALNEVVRQSDAEAPVDSSNPPPFDPPRETFDLKALLDTAAQVGPLRFAYAVAIALAVLLVMLASTYVMIKIGAAHQWKDIPSEIVIAYFGTVFGEVVGLMAAVTLSLFPRRQDDAD